MFFPISTRPSKTLFTSIKEQAYDNYEIIILQSDDNLKNLIIKILNEFIIILYNTAQVCERERKILIR